MTVRLTAIGIHPVKSTAIRRVAQADVGFAGLRGDREWMVVDETGEMISARVEPRLFTITASTPATGDTAADLLLEAPGLSPLEVSHPQADAVDVRLFRTKELVARPAGAEADAWIRQAVGRDDLRLVWCHDPRRRRLRRGREGDHAAFQDGYPVTLLSEESVAQVDAWMGEDARARGETPPAPISARRFRPNLLVEGAPAAFAEDDWERVRIGDVVLRRAKLVDRCVMTTIDPDDLSRGKDPIRTLAAHRRWDGSTWCAVHYIPEATGRVGVGDRVIPF
ncbi:MOSC domain-containing protein [Mobilicoccus massiliensis]|uniref:MOSC domain-containing protein n=1 Tax=Mobilicoccus massiliensis TaxID=1522310 RepID=UPI00058CFEB5|nr:MOSC N-terminal beta barrel domain-containing protein [Mobilicoccus massiliensis]